jgi:biopolymer transport protein ExbD
MLALSLQLGGAPRTDPGARRTNGLDAGRRELDQRVSCETASRMRTSISGRPADGTVCAVASCALWIATIACASGTQTATAAHSTPPSVELAPAPAAPQTPAAPDNEPAAGSVVVDVPVSGAVRVDGAPRADAGLGDALAHHAGKRVEIRAAADVAWSRIIRVLDALRTVDAGSARFVLALQGDPKRRSLEIHFPRSPEWPAPPPAEPPAADAPEYDHVAPAPILMMLARDGRARVGGEPTDGADRRRRLREQMAAATRRVLIVGELETPFGAVVDAVLDAQAEGAIIAFGISR